MSGAPNIASRGDGPAGSEGRGVAVAWAGFASRGAVCSLLIAGVNLGEKGAVRCRTGVGCWLGTDDGCDAFEGGVGARGTGSDRGIGGGHAGGAACTGVRGRAVIGCARDAAPIAAVAGEATTGSSSPQLTAAPTGIRPPHIEHRARMETLVIFAGSSRKTDRHSGQETFIESAG